MVEPVNTTLTFTTTELEKLRQFGFITESGVVFHEELAGPGGMSFVLLRERFTTSSMLKLAVNELRCNRDVVGHVRVTTDIVD